ncbi:hypothetical protein C8J57DRAFT_293869 [Mycena rebaudengoi]|nr:hypothetical protein C8J57DRAFT_293869 [Mycena rebaudengoi]
MFASLLSSSAALLLVSHSVLAAPTRDNTVNSLSIRQITGNIVSIPFQLPNECRPACEPFLSLLQAGFGSLPVNTNFCTLANTKIMFGCTECASSGPDAVNPANFKPIEDTIQTRCQQALTGEVSPGEPQQPDGTGQQTGGAPQQPNTTQKTDNTNQQSSATQQAGASETSQKGGAQHMSAGPMGTLVVVLIAFASFML